MQFYDPFRGLDEKELWSNREKRRGGGGNRYFLFHSYKYKFPSGRGERERERERAEGGCVCRTEIRDKMGWSLFFVITQKTPTEGNCFHIGVITQTDSPWFPRGSPEGAPQILI